MCSLSLRSRYAGEVIGLLSPNAETSEREALMNDLIADVWRACETKDSNEHRHALWRATAMLISSPGTNYSLGYLK